VLRQSASTPHSEPSPTWEGRAGSFALRAATCSSKLRMTGAAGLAGLAGLTAPFVAPLLPPRPSSRRAAAAAETRDSFFAAAAFTFGSAAAAALLWTDVNQNDHHIDTRLATSH